MTRFLWAIACWMLIGSAPRLGMAQSAPADTVAGPAAADTTAPVALPDTLGSPRARVPQSGAGSLSEGVIASPNRTPYRSDRSWGEHVLAAPSYLLHYATRPLGWAVKEVEERFPRIFEGEWPPYGFYPILEIGGESDVAGGVVAFYHDLPWGGHAADLRVLFGSSAYNRFVLNYHIPEAFGSDSELQLRGRYFNDPGERFFLGGNEAGEEDRSPYATRQIDVELSASRDLSTRIDGALTARFQRSTIRPEEVEADDLDEERPLPSNLAGVGTASLLSTEAAVSFDLTSRQERSVEGTRLRLVAAYGQSLPDAQFRFGRYRVEAVQFVPMPFLPRQRRLALRGRLEKVEALGDGVVPFYRLPSLGGTDVLRGYRANRFQDEGALTLTAEYRYPIWDNLDAVLFAEAGQVFSAYEDLALSHFHAGYGGGIHLVTGGTLAFRFEIAGGEDLRTILTVSPAF